MGPAAVGWEDGVANRLGKIDDEAGTEEDAAALRLRTGEGVALRTGEAEGGGKLAATTDVSSTEKSVK